MYTITEDNSNKDLVSGADSREYYLRLHGDFHMRSGLPKVDAYGDKYILRADTIDGGLKAYGAEKLIATTKEEVLVYCAPRNGHAPSAIAAVAEKYGKRVIFFSPASKRPSDHQAVLLTKPNCEVRFIRIAAMPVLNKYAREFAEVNGYRFLPFGLTGTPLVTAGLIHLATQVSKAIGEDPSEIHCAVSTGTMIRAFQIAWPNALAKGVAVARNIHAGEKGEADLIPATMPFLKEDPIAKTMPFPTTASYDAKAFDRFDKEGRTGSIFINVGADQHITRDLSMIDIDLINSDREWGDLSATRP